MNREIKFRAWDNHCRYFISFDFSQPHFDDDANQVTFDCDKVMGDHGGAERFTFQQFTGLKDKNGKEIYEGDVVQKWNTHNHPHKPDATLGRFQVLWETATVGFNLTGNRSHIYEVIGNIYENPELLKQ